MYNPERRKFKAKATAQFGAATESLCIGNAKSFVQGGTGEAPNDAIQQSS